MSTKQIKIKELEKLNKLLRYWILDMTTIAGSGHPTSALSAVELMTTLMFAGVFRFDVKKIDSENNDRLIFSKGHASPLFYALWAAAGVVSPDELNSFRKFDSNLEGHPTMNFSFTEAATGSLGQGLSIGVGMALAQKNLDKTNARTYVLLGDSEMAEGQVWEAMNIASYYELGNLIAIVDVNRLGQRGETMLGHDTEKYAARARAFGWRTVVVDGHNVSEVMRVYFDMIGDHKKPLMIIAKTYKGKGISFLENKYGWHGKVLSKQEFIEAVNELGEIDFDVRGNISKSQKSNVSVETHCNASLQKEDNADLNKKYATRDAYGDTLVEMMRNDEKIVVLDAEVSNSTRSAVVKDFYPERFFEMFIAEQNMVSVAVGLARRGYKPFCSTFAAFFTRAHDQIRMASLSKSKITFVGSHAGVSIGEDGGSQMGLSDIAMFRAILGSTVMYPSDLVSARKILQLTQNMEGISYVRTTREKTSSIYNETEEFMMGGSKLLRHSSEDEAVIITAGITVHEALKAYEILQIKDVNVRVIDLYSIKPIDAELLLGSIGDVSHIIIVEDHFAQGGIGEAVQDILSGLSMTIAHLAVRKMPHSGTMEDLMQYEKINYSAIIDEVYKSANKLNKSI